MTDWRLRPMGDRAVLIDCSATAASEVATALARAPLKGQRELVPGARSVLVILDSTVGFKDVVAHLAAIEIGHAADADIEAEAVTIDVVYDGPDLAEVAATTGLDVEGVVAAHTSTPWRVAFTGFAPGFGYLTGGDPRLAVPRRASPRPEVPAGAVGLAGEFSGVYPRASPGGWQLIGRTDAVLWSADRDPPALLRPGTVVRFRSVREPSPVVSVTTRPGAFSHSQPDSESSSRGGRGPSGAGGGRSITVVRAGISCLVEDLGRPGLAAQGVPRSGAADRGAARRANRIVGNRVGAAVLEVIPGRVEVISDGALLVAVTGAPATVTVDGVPARIDAPIALSGGQVLTIAAPRTGLRCYLAVRGGVAVSPVLGSRSTDLLTGLGPSAVHAGDVLPIGDDHWGTPRVVEPPAGRDLPALTALSGPHADWFAGGLAALTETAWLVLPASNRIGVRLDGPSLCRTRDGEVPTQGLVPGTVQVPPDGRPVILFVDHPVTGGYPVVAVVASTDLDLLSQLRPGQSVRLVAGNSAP